MKIIVCGIDKSGKTTLTNKIASDLSCTRVHFTCPKPVISKDDVILTPNIPVFNQIMKHTYQHRHENLVYDRYIYSDIVYGPIYRNPDHLFFRETERTYSELVMQSSGMIGIYAESSNAEKNLKMIEDEGEGVIDDDKFIIIRNHYRRIFEKTAKLIPTMRYDWTTMSMDSVIDFIRDQDDKLKSNGLYTLLKDSNWLLNGYIGPIWRRPTTIYQVPDISYDSYLDVLMNNPNEIGNSNIALAVDVKAVQNIFNCVVEKE